jgi:signal transduction histidine kinase
MTDLARAVMSEVALRELAIEALEGLRALHELEHQRDDMVHMLVHDLRNPLASMLAGLDMLEAIPGLTDRHRKYVERCRSGGRTLLEMINEILTVSRSDAGMLKLDLAPLSAQQLIEQAVDGIAHLAAAAAVQVTLNVPRSLPPFVGDAAKLNRVLVNLIANALTHTPRQGHIEVAVETRSDGALGFTVADTGPGIAEADLGRIFEKFEQGRSARSTRSSGSSSGIGLAFCKAVVEGHGGHIWAENAATGGAALRFALPAAPAGS